MTKSFDVLRGGPSLTISDLPVSNDSPEQQENPLIGKITPEGDGLAVSLAGLSRLSLRRLNQDDLLTRLATLAAAAIPGAEGAGVTLIEPGQPDIVARSAPFVREVDDVQYGLGVGPSSSAAATRQTMRSGSIGADRRWPQFGARVARLGVHSVLSVPLISQDMVVGSLNAYSHAMHAFDERAEHMGESFAAPAGILVQNMQILARTSRRAEDFRAGLTNRAVTDQAIGIMMSRLGVSADEASIRLCTLSRRERVTVTEVAAAIVQAAVHRARARRLNGPTPQGGS